MEQINVNENIPSKIYSCDQCPKTYRHKQSLNRHVEKVHHTHTLRGLRVVNLNLKQTIYHLNREIEIYRGYITFQINYTRFE